MGLSEEYKFFIRKDMRKAFREATKNVSDYLKKHNIKNVILIDRSARPVWIALKTTNPDLKIHFLQPEKTLKEIRKERKDLIELVRNERVAVIDDFMESGKTIRRVVERLGKLGGKEVHPIVLGSSLKALKDERNKKVFVGKEGVAGIEQIAPWYWHFDSRGVEEIKQGNKHKLVVVKDKNKIKLAREVREEIKRVLKNR